jgi:hypothetical protein
MESKVDELYFLCIRQIFFNVKRKTPEHTLFTLDVGKVRDKKLLSRLLIGAYLQGFEEINIIGGEGIPEEMREEYSGLVREP